MQPTLELLGFKSEVDMHWPIVTLAKRKLGYKFMCAEAWWILSGQNRVAEIARFSKEIANFSDDGLFFFGAYGPRIVDQLPHVIRCLSTDNSSRQAVINIWRESPPISKDIPCTLSVQFIIRDGQLDCFVNMRSSDAWLGVPYDWFNFSMLSGAVCLLLKSVMSYNLRLGTLHFYAASQHLYEKNFEIAQDIVRDEGMSHLCVYEAFNPYNFMNFERLLEHLSMLAHGTGDGAYLTTELRDYYAPK
jgi:thymidylate synthase